LCFAKIAFVAAASLQLGTDQKQTQLRNAKWTPRGGDEETPSFMAAKMRRTKQGCHPSDDARDGKVSTKECLVRLTLAFGMCGLNRNHTVLR
jgi:hypothetical protein